MEETIVSDACSFTARLFLGSKTLKSLEEMEYGNLTDGLKSCLPSSVPAAKLTRVGFHHNEKEIFDDI